MRASSNKKPKILYALHSFFEAGMKYNDPFNQPHQKNLARRKSRSFTGSLTLVSRTRQNINLDPCYSATKMELVSATCHTIAYDAKRYKTVG